MKPTDQRISIAEYCGAVWQKDHFGNPLLASGKSEDDIVLAVDAADKGMMILGLPDYPNDLNAMHEAEKKLTEEQQWNYFQILAERCGDTGGRLNRSTAVMMLGWNAESKAEAFLKAIGKWEEGE